MSESSSPTWLLTRPALDEGEAVSIADDAFGLAGTAEELGSQQDRNFKVTGENGQSALLKIDNPATGAEVLDLQARAAHALQQMGIATPALRATKDGELHADITTSQGARTTARMYAFIDGHALADDEPLTVDVAYRQGMLAGDVVTALHDFSHPAATRPIQWELSHARGVVSALIDHLPEERRDACLDAATAADSLLRELSAELPTQTIHGDVTADNVMCDPMGAWWLIDLGDVATSYRVAELAVAAADALGRSGSLATVGRLVAGFASRVALTDAELRALWPLVVLRGAVLAVSGWSQLDIDPDNTYARERLDHEWRVFTAAVDMDWDAVEAELRLAAGLPHRAGLSYAPVFSDAGASSDFARLDFSTTSRDLDRGVWLERDIEPRLARATLASTDVAVAPFGVARLTRAMEDIAARPRTRARCVELWSRAGRAVTAPFAGELRRIDGGVELRDAGVVLTITGLSPTVSAEEASTRTVSAGEPLGEIHDETDGIGRITVSRRQAGTEAAPSFGFFDDPFTVDGALDPSPILGLSPSDDPDVHLAIERVRRNQAMGGASERYYDAPPQIERGWRTSFVDTRGRTYLDMVNNVTAIGHSHPRMAEAVERQLSLLNTNSRFLYEAYADFTEALLQHAPDPSLDTVIPVNSGSEALDLAIRLAQVATGRADIVAAREGYHGWTMAADAVTTSAFDNPQALGSRPDWVHIVDAPNPYRGTHRGDEARDRYIADLHEHLAQMSASDTPPAAFLCEPVLGNAGGVMPPAGYLADAYAAVREHGGLAIADEVQVGYGRLGHAFWGSQLLGAVPDIIAVAKAAGNGYPFGAVLTTRAIVDALRNEGMFFSSAGGSPASAVAGTVVLDVIREEGLQGNARTVGDFLRSELEALSEKHRVIGAVHGSGLYLGLELVTDREARTPARDETRWVCDRLLDHGVVMQATSERQNVLKIKPPLVISQDEAQMFIRALDTTLAELSARSTSESNSVSFAK